MTYDRIAQREKDIDTLARTIYGEARGEGLSGMKAVACVVMNRLKKPGWWSRQKGDDIPDDTVQAVCRDPYQFSCWLHNDPNLPKLLLVNETDSTFKQALQIAEQAVDHGLTDITNGATSYHTIKPPRPDMKWPPYWADGMKECAVWGAHVYYK